MDTSKDTTRPPSGNVSRISPAMSTALRTGTMTTDQLLVELVDQFKLDAMAIDPTITGLWLYRDMTMQGRDLRGVVQGIFLDRAHDTLRASDRKAGA